MSVGTTVLALQQQVAPLLDSVQEITDTAIDQIENIGEAYAVHINKLKETFYVANTGSDTNSGLQENSPIKTIKKAIELTPIGGVAYIYLLTDTHILDKIDVVGKNIHIKSIGSVRHKITFEHTEYVQNGNEYSNVAGFNMQSSAVVSVRNIKIQIPHSDGTFSNNIYGARSALFQGSVGEVSRCPQLAVGIIDCDIGRPANSQVSILGNPNGAVCITTRSIVETDQTLSGYWVIDIAAGTAHVYADVANSSPFAQSEIFGPVAPLICASDEAEALCMANDTQYGLSSSVFTTNESRGLQFAQGIEAGMTHINDITIHDYPHVMFGGEKNSGIGRFNGEWAIEEFTTDQFISIQR